MAPTRIGRLKTRNIERERSLCRAAKKKKYGLPSQSLALALYAQHRGNLTSGPRFDCEGFSSCVAIT